jgi:lysophospholipase L1-like esterase
MAFLRQLSAALALTLVSGLSAVAGTEAHFLTELEKGRSQKVVVYGTSLTANAAWPAELEDTLRASLSRKLRVVNAGRGGMDSRWGLANFEQRVIRERPDTVFIEFAINDALAKSHLSVGESMSNLEHMISTLRGELPYCDVIVMVMNPPTGTHFHDRSRFDDYANGYRLVAKRNACRFINFSAIWKPIIAREPERWKNYAPDGLHPNEQACREVILPYLLKKIGFTQPPAPAGT